MYICFATVGFTAEERYLPANIKNTEGLALSQEGKLQTHSGKVHDVQQISAFSQQDYQV